MKKSLLALAVLGAFAGVASAQSSVTIYGTVDLNGRYVKNDGQDARYSLSQDGINSSQLVFAGREDLGGGGWAGFNLNMGVNADSGTTNNKTFNRRSTVSLGGNWGEIRMGRDYTPTFWNYTVFDAFGTNGVGNSLNVLGLTGAANGLGVTSSSFYRADNSIGYFLPSFGGGFYGQVMMAAGEGGNLPQANGQQQGSTSTGQTCVTPAQTVAFNPGSVGINPPIGQIVTVKVPAQSCSTAVNGNAGHYYGGRLGFAAGPFDVAGSYGQQGVDTFNDDSKSWSVGGSFNFGIAKVMGYYAEAKFQSLKSQMYSISGVIPLGAGEIHVGFEEGKLKFGNEPRADQFAVGYVYNLSKRTAVYSNASWIKNHNNAAASVASGSAIPPNSPNSNGDSQGIEFGLRHFF